MFNDQEIPESMKKFFDEMRENFGIDDSSYAESQSLHLKKSIEIQILVMQQYQKILDDQLSKDPGSDILSQMTKNFMSTYIDFMRFWREYRKKTLELQYEIIQKNLSIYQEMLQRINTDKL